MSLRSSLPKLLVTFGIALIFLAVFSNALGLTSGEIGKARILCGLCGLGLLAIGVLKRRFLTVYQSTILLIANSIVLLLVLEFGAMCWHKVNPPNKDPSAAVNSSRREIFVAYTGVPFESELVNVGEDGLRVTVSDFEVKQTLEYTTDSTIRIFAFGGSTMWGEGASDDQTIASYLQTFLLEKTKQPIEVKNFGQRGWISTQNLIRLMLELRSGNIPDAVVFYDGYNDTTAAALTGQAGVPESLGVLIGSDASEATIVRTARKTALGRLVLPNSTRNYPKSDAEQLSTDIADTYLQIHRMVEGLGQRYGFEVHFYLQPQLIIGNKPLTDAEQKIHDAHPWLPNVVRDTATLSYEKIRISAGSVDRLTDISDAFDKITGPLYLDPCHITGVGNKRVAELMLERGLLESIGHLIEQRHEQP